MQGHHTTHKRDYTTPLIHKFAEELSHIYGDELAYHRYHQITSFPVEE